MTSENKEILDRINAYAEKVLADIDPQKTKISFQLEALKPVMQEIADEKKLAVEDIFILYMDISFSFFYFLAGFYGIIQKIPIKHACITIFQLKPLWDKHINICFNAL